MMDVLRRADINQLEMEHAEGWSIAEKEIVHIMRQEERESAFDKIWRKS